MLGLSRSGTLPCKDPPLLAAVSGVLVGRTGDRPDHGARKMTMRLRDYETTLWPAAQFTTVNIQYGLQTPFISTFVFGTVPLPTGYVSSIERLWADGLFVNGGGGEWPVRHRTVQS